MSEKKSSEQSPQPAQAAASSISSMFGPTRLLPGESAEVYRAGLIATIKDLGAAKLLVMLDLLGLQLGATSQKRPRNALQLVSQSASVSYKNSLAPSALAGALVDGHLPPGITPQVATLLDEAPLPLIVATVEEVAAASQCPAKTLWKHMFQWAHDLHSPRPVWA